MTDFIKKIKNTVNNILFPVRCLYCGKVIDANEYACKNCKKQFPDELISGFAAGGYQCVSIFPYEGIFKKAILKFKFGNCGGYSKQLSFVIVQGVLNAYNTGEFDVVTCVPMHKKSLKARGYNQAELLAKDCAEFLHIPYADLLEKFKENKAQHTLKANKREANVRGVFRIIDESLVKNKNILIIDDIITTGHTLGECAKTLEKHGSKSVSCAAFCSARTK